MILLAAAALAQDTDPEWLDAAREAEEPAPPEDPAPPADAPTTARGATFAQALDVFGLEVNWSGYGDLSFEWVPSERVLTFEAGHFNPLLGARLAPPLWAEVEIEFEDSGTVVQLEYAILDYRPHPAFGLRLGQFLVPIGQFNEYLHPSFRWPQVSRPAMFRDVVPVTWSETGIMARGEARTRDLSFGYAAYVANGLGSEFDPALAEPIRASRRNAEDENYDLAVGGQLEVEALPGRTGQTHATASVYTGAIDQTGDLRLTIVNVALATELGPVTLRGEAARDYLGAGDAWQTPYSEGMYAQAAVEVGRFTPSVRYDLVRTDLPNAEVSSAFVATTMVRLFTFWNVRAEVQVPLQDPAPEFAAMSAFFF